MVLTGLTSKHVLMDQKEFNFIMRKESEPMLQCPHTPMFHGLLSTINTMLLMNNLLDQTWSNSSVPPTLDPSKSMLVNDTEKPKYQISIFVRLSYCFIKRNQTIIKYQNKDLSSTRIYPLIPSIFFILFVSRSTLPFLNYLRTIKQSSKYNN